jgi:hypothetical protein
VALFKDKPEPEVTLTTKIVQEKETSKTVESPEELMRFDNNQPVKVTPEERRKQIESRKVQALVTGTERFIENGDFGMGFFSYIVFGVACATFRGYFFFSIIFLCTSILLMLLKHRLPEGPIIRWIRKPVSQIVQDVKLTMSGRR